MFLVDLMKLKMHYLGLERHQTRYLHSCSIFDNICHGFPFSSPFARSFSPPMTVCNRSGDIRSTLQRV